MRLIVFLTACLAAAVDDDRSAQPPPKPVVVVAAPAYRTELEPWLARRREQGFHVELVDPAAVIGRGDGAAAVDMLVREIGRQVSQHRDSVLAASFAQPRAFVLLVGDAPGPAEEGDWTRLVPAAIEIEQARPSAPKRFVSDNVFGLPDERGRARVAVGRWPVRTPAEVAVQVAKSRRFEQAQTPGAHRHTITFLATTPNYDPVFDPLLEQLAMGVVNANVRPHWGLRALYASPRSPYFPGPEETSRQLVRWLEESTPMTLFAGHGYDRGVDSVRCEGKLFTVLDSDVAERVNGNRPGTVLWVSACSCGDYDLAPPRRGLAEALMMNPRGPTAVIAGSDETSAWVNLLLCLGLGQDVIDDPPATLGEAFMRFKHAAFKPGPALLKSLLLRMEPIERPEFSPSDHQFLYNLLGDPTLELRLPRRVSFHARVEERPAGESGQKRFVLSGKLDGWDAGFASLALVLDRMAMKARSPDVSQLTDAAARRAAYFERFHMANDKRAAEVQVSLRDGEFEAEMTLPEALAPLVRWLQLYVHTPPRPDGSWSDGIGAQAVRLVADERD